ASRDDRWSVRATIASWIADIQGSSFSSRPPGRKPTSAIHDAIVALTDQRSSRDAKGLIDDLSARGQLSMESVTFLRGRSLHRQFVVVDEAQNLEPTTLKTILTRIGEGTKVVFTGDTSQIDAPYMGESNNALAVLIHAFADQHCFGHITLSSCERSEVASLAAELL
ncbi:MAG: PhoH family protein, partial [Actinomycetota bacterium]